MSAAVRLARRSSLDYSASKQKTKGKLDDHSRFRRRALHDAQGGSDLALCAGGEPGHRRPRAAHRDRGRPRGLRLCLRHPAHGLDQGHAEGRARAVPPARDRQGSARHRGDSVWSSTRRCAARRRRRPRSIARCTSSWRARSACRSTCCSAARCATACRSCASSRSRRRPRWRRQAQKLVDKGYRYLKIKVHGDVEEDVARVAAIRKQVGDDVHLTIDANQSYTTKDAITALNRMAEYRIDLVRAAGRCRRFRRACARHQHGAGDGRGRRGGGLAARDLRAGVEARGRCGEPENPQARRLAQHARGRAPVRGRRTSSTGSAPRSAAGCSPRRRCISPARCRASTMPASSASSTGCSTIRSRASRSRTACSSCRRARAPACALSSRPRQKSERLSAKARLRDQA